MRWESARTMITDSNWIHPPLRHMGCVDVARTLTSCDPLGACLPSNFGPACPMGCSQTNQCRGLCRVAPQTTHKGSSGLFLTEMAMVAEAGPAQKAGRHWLQAVAMTMWLLKFSPLGSVEAEIFESFFLDKNNAHRS